MRNEKIDVEAASKELVATEMMLTASAHDGVAANMMAGNKESEVMLTAPTGGSSDAATKVVGSVHECCCY